MKNKRVHILLVDDDQSFVEIMQFYLERQGYKVSYTFYLEKVLEIIKTQNPDIVFLDLRLSMKNNLKIIQNIKELNSRLPVVVITAYGSSKELETACSAGADHVMLKSSDFEEFEQTVNRFASKTP